VKLWHKGQRFKGCWRKHSGGTLTDLRLCAFCVFHRHPGCEHVCPGYRYGDVSVRVKENNGKKFKAKTERIWTG
jgi:hypothetical protein